MAEEETTPSLEALASQFEPQQSEPVKTIPEQEAPKFESSEEAIEWMAKQHSETRAQLESLVESNTKKEQDAFVDSQMAALDEAIKTIGKDVELDPVFIEGALHTTYNRDKNFQKIFDNRDQNPDAYNKALSIVAGDLKAKSSSKHDAEAVASERALSELQRSSRTGTPDADPATDLSAAEFDHYWEKLKTG